MWYVYEKEAEFGSKICSISAEKRKELLAPSDCDDLDVPFKVMDFTAVIYTHQYCLGAIHVAPRTSIIPTMCFLLCLVKR